jgi:Cu+-exporting ATPase
MATATPIPNPAKPSTSTPVTANTTITFPVEGMSCAACQVHVQGALREAPGVVDATVNLMTHQARVIFDPAIVQPVALAKAVHESGYEAVLPTADAAHDATAHDHSADAGEESETHLRYRAFSTIAAGAAAMLLSMPLMSTGAHTTMGMTGKILMAAAPWLYQISPLTLKLILLAMTIAGMIWAGSAIYGRAWSALLHRSTNMNTLVALGTGAAFAYSVVSTIDPGIFLRHGLRPDVYYESVLLILGFLLLGNWLEARARRRTLDAVHAFMLLQPQTARILTATGEIVVPVESVLSGDTVVLRPGERVPVDGAITSGESSVDESLITGESVPIVKVKGDKLIGGSLNYDGALEYRATSVGADSMLSQMLRLMEEAQSSRAQTQQLADRVSSIFVPVVIVIAVVTFIVWAIADPHEISRAFAISVAVLVIACPCAMGLAVPAALTVAIGRGAQLGILFKGGESVERLARVNTVVLDKTGTLTTGKPRITAMHGAPGVTEEALIQYAVSLEQRSEHPLARAVEDYAKSRDIPPTPVQDLRVIPGKGVTGSVSAHIIAAGNAALFQELAIAIPGETKNSEGATQLHIAIDNKYAGYFEAHDQLRAGAAEAILDLKNKGLTVIMLTGDSEAAAAPVAHQLALDEYHANLLPEQKLAKIRQLQSAGKIVAMVGDGINDAAALAQADAGLAIGTGSDLAREAGDAILLRGEPRSIFIAIELARRTLGVMRQNLAWALGYNLIGIPIAAGVLYPATGILLSPVVASAAMALSSVSVLMNSLRLKAFHPK